MIIWIGKEKWQKKGQIYSRGECNDRAKEWMFWNVMFSFFTLNTDLFDFSTEMWMGKKSPTQQIYKMLPGSYREKLYVNSQIILKASWSKNGSEGQLEEEEKKVVNSWRKFYFLKPSF